MDAAGSVRLGELLPDRPYFARPPAYPTHQTYASLADLVTCVAMLGAFQGGAVLLLLSVFFAHVLAPAVVSLRRRVRIGPRHRPLSRPAAILLLYLTVFVPGAFVWRGTQDAAVHWVHVTAPAAVERLFSGGNFEPFERLIARAPISPGAQRRIVRRLERAMSYVEREVRTTLNELIAAARYARWLAVTPILAFLLLTAAPGFQRSTLRVLPRGHLQWRAEEYLRDVNSALAGYVRAQAAAAVIVGVECVAGFALLGLPSAVSLGVAAGVLELVPAIGPLTALLVAGSQAGDRVLVVIVFLSALRIVQDYVIYPRLIRHRMHMSTIAVILTIWIGAALAGAAGVILAIPVAGFLSVSFRHWREYRDIERLVRSTEESRR
jgi:predicted PurR-regulated permease PerM